MRPCIGWTSFRTTDTTASSHHLLPRVLRAREVQQDLRPNHRRQPNLPSNPQLAIRTGGDHDNLWRVRQSLTCTAGPSDRPPVPSSATDYRNLGTNGLNRTRLLAELLQNATDSSSNVLRGLFDDRTGLYARATGRLFHVVEV